MNTIDIRLTIISVNVYEPHIPLIINMLERYMESGTIIMMPLNIEIINDILGFSMACIDVAVIILIPVKGMDKK